MTLSCSFAYDQSTHKQMKLFLFTNLLPISFIKNIRSLTIGLLSILFMDAPWPPMTTPSQNRDSIKNFEYLKYVHLEGVHIVRMYIWNVSVHYICKCKYHMAQMATKSRGTYRKTRDHLNWSKGGSCSSAWTTITRVQCGSSVVIITGMPNGWDEIHFFFLFLQL